MNAATTRGPRVRAAILATGLLLAVAAFGLGGISGCSDNGESPTGDTPDPVTAFFPADYETSYTTIVDDCRFSGPHGPLIKIYASTDAADTYQNQLYQFDEGAVIVKALYDGACANIQSFVVMKKLVDGAAPGGGDWEWQEVAPDRSVMRSGQLSDCIGCHTDCSSQDWTCLEFN